MMQIINNTGAIIKEQINLGNIDDLNIDDLFKDNTNNKKMKNNNYPNWLVSLEIAKELKEIGFDTPCTFLWDSYEDVNEIRCYLDEHPEECDVFLPGSYNYNNPNSSGYYSYTSLPTWEQVFEWFRDRKYFGSVHTNNIDKLEFYYEINSPRKYTKGYSNSYEESREDLIRELINMYKDEKEQL